MRSEGSSGKGGEGAPNSSTVNGSERKLIRTVKNKQKVNLHTIRPIKYIVAACYCTQTFLKNRVRSTKFILRQEKYFAFFLELKSLFFKVLAGTQRVNAEGPCG